MDFLDLGEDERASWVRNWRKWNLVLWDDDAVRGPRKKRFLSPEQLDEAMRLQQQTKEPDLGRIFTSLGMVGEREVLQAKAQEMGIGFVDLDRVQIESSAINVVPERIARAHSVFPVKKDGQTLWLAMANDKNILALEDVKMASGCRVVPVLAVSRAIEDAIERYYSRSTSHDC
jgi:type IV pilus assembly protein PilB